MYTQCLDRCRCLIPFGPYVIDAAQEKQLCTCVHFVSVYRCVHVCKFSCSLIRTFMMKETNHGWWGQLSWQIPWECSWSYILIEFEFARRRTYGNGISELGHMTRVLGLSRTQFGVRSAGYNACKQYGMYPRHGTDSTFSWRNRQMTAACRYW